MWAQSPWRAWRGPGVVDSRSFVQFSHPGGEHAPDRGCEKAWHNPENGPHRRKFMQLCGRWIDENGNRQAGVLHAWGEWEPESEVVAKLDPPDGDPRHPRYLWRPFYVPREDYRELHNTDPFIFGECFLYSNCRQEKNSGLRHLARGSVIAFGSCKKDSKKRWRWLLDTVLVVRDFIDYDQSKAREALRDRVPVAFLDVTGGPLAAANAGAERSSGTCTPTGLRLRLYRGATPDNHVDGMFSFFPALPPAGRPVAKVPCCTESGGLHRRSNAAGSFATGRGGDARGFPRPVIDLPSEYFNPASCRAPKGIRRSRKPDELRALWDRIVAQVRKAGLVLGTHAELPGRRPSRPRSCPP